jgi:hypothetical protein
MGPLLTEAGSLPRRDGRRSAIARAALLKGASTMYKRLVLRLALGAIAGGLTLAAVNALPGAVGSAVDRAGDVRYMPLGLEGAALREVTVLIIPRNSYTHVEAFDADGAGLLCLLFADRYQRVRTTVA